MSSELTEEQKQRKRDYQSKYRTTEKGKATARRYWSSEKGKAKAAEPSRSHEARKEYHVKYRKRAIRKETLRRYNQSDKRKETSRRYNQTEKGITANREKVHRYNRTEKGKAARCTSFNRRRKTGKIDASILLQVKREEPNCRKCTNPATETDHILPLADGGMHDRANLQRLCTDCHRKKTAKENRIRMRKS